MSVKHGVWCLASDEEHGLRGVSGQKRDEINCLVGSGIKVEKDEMGVLCSTRNREKKCVHGFVVKA
jgi:hypothetical protein